MTAPTPLPWRQRPLLMFPDADPRVWAGKRKQALDLVLNANLRCPREVNALAGQLASELGHGARAHDQQWGQWQDDVKALRRYALGKAPACEWEATKLRELNVLCQQVFALDASDRWTCTTMTDVDYAAAPPSAPSIRTISAEVFWTVQLLKEHDALDIRRCRREECGRWFLALNGRTESCSEQCRVAYAQGH